MHIAILIAGYSRSMNINIESWKQYLIKDNTYDIYLHISDDETYKDRYLNNVDIDKIKKDISIKYIIFSKNIQFSNDSKINNIYNQYYKYTLLNNLKNNSIETENINYDIVIKLRPDVLLIKEINFEKDLENIYIPIDSKIDKNKLHNEWDNYICDIIAYSNNNNMNNYFKFFYNLNTLINEYGNVQETLLFHYLTQNNMKYKLVHINYNIILSLCNIINIAGDSSSGKTTLSSYIQKSTNNSFVLECDRYHKWERGNINWDNYTHLNPQANYLSKMDNDVFDLKIGKNIYQIDYDHSCGKFTDKKLIESKDNIIVCGLHSNYLKNTNLSIFMDTDINLRIPWKIKRDMIKRGYTYDKILDQINTRTQDYLEYIYPQILTSNVIIQFYTNEKYSEKNINDDKKVMLNLYIEKKFNILDFIKYINNLNYKYKIEEFENTNAILFNVIKLEYLEIDYYELIIIMINNLKVI
jgi:uridine kinase